MAAKRGNKRIPSARATVPAPSVPDEMSSAQAKDQISDVVKKAVAGGRTTILSRGYAIAIIGPLHDVPPSAERDALRLPTTEIKSGQTSLKGTIARGDYAILTIHGEDRAAVYRPDVRRHPAQTEDKLERLIDLLEESALVDRENRRALDESVRLRRIADALHEEIAALLDLMDKIDPARAAVWRERCAAIKQAREAARS
jgi:antitoxin (DNA-binding transcriptional repressor) of toxin-antitoxin stability system